MPTLSHSAVNTSTDFSPPVKPYIPEFDKKGFESTGRLLPCPFGCFKKLKRVRDVQAHLDQHHSTSDGNDELEDGIPCRWPECKRTIVSDGNMRLHVQRHLEYSELGTFPPACTLSPSSSSLERRNTYVPFFDDVSSSGSSSVSLTPSEQPEVAHDGLTEAHLTDPPRNAVDIKEEIQETATLGEHDSEEAPSPSPVPESIIATDDGSVSSNSDHDPSSIPSEPHYYEVAPADPVWDEITIKESNFVLRHKRLRRAGEERVQFDVEVEERGSSCSHIVLFAKKRRLASEPL